MFQDKVSLDSKFFQPYRRFDYPHQKTVYESLFKITEKLKSAAYLKARNDVHELVTANFAAIEEFCIISGVEDLKFNPQEIAAAVTLGTKVTLADCAAVPKQLVCVASYFYNMILKGEICNDPLVSASPELLIALRGKIQQNLDDFTAKMIALECV